MTRTTQEILLQQTIANLQAQIAKLQKSVATITTSTSAPVVTSKPISYTGEAPIEVTENVISINPIIDGGSA